MAEEFDVGDKVRRWMAKLDDPSEALNLIGLEMVSESQGAFKPEKFGDTQWKKRAPINVYGIIKDLTTEGRSAPHDRRFTQDKTLQDTGRLKGSFSHVVQGSSVTAGTNLDYAKPLHEGGEIESEKMDESFRTKLQTWLKGKGKKYAGSLGFLLNEKYRNERLQGEVDARPLVGITDQTEEAIAYIIRTSIMETE